MQNYTKIFIHSFRGAWGNKWDYHIYKDHQKIGVVTSGTVSPMLDKGIGLGYVDIDNAKIGKQIDIKIREKLIPAIIIKPPFV